MAQGDVPRSVVPDAEKGGKLPSERFANANELRQYCGTLIEADRKRSALRARVEALRDGFPAYPKGQLDSAGMGWFPRVNYRELEGYIQNQATPLYDLVVEVDHCIDLELDINASSSEERDQWEEDIQEAFTWLNFKRWRTGFNYNLLLSQDQMLLHGLGAQLNINKRWIPRTPKAGQLLFPDGAPLDFQQDGKFCLLRDFVPGEDVYGFIRNEQAAAKLGWKIDNVWATLAKAGKQNAIARGGRNNSFEEIQRRMQRGDMGYSNTSQVGLWLNWSFVAEYDGGVSLYCTDETISCGNKDKGYLYVKRFAFDEFPITLFPFNGVADITSQRGLGMRSKDFFELSNRMKNAMVAQVLISAFPMVQETSPNVDPDKAALMRLGAMSRIPYGLSFAQIQFPSLNNTGLALSKELKDTLAENNQSMSSGAPEAKDRETAYSFSVRAQDQARISNGLQSLYESNLREAYYRQYCLLIETPNGNQRYQKLAKEFRDRCKKKGVPDAALKVSAIGDFRENTATGAGSAATRLHAILSLMQYIYPTAPRDKQITIKRDLTSVLMGGSKVDRYVERIGDTDMPNQDDSLAMQESNGLALGGDAIVGTQQDDIKHATNHLQKAAQIQQQVQQGQMDPKAAFTALQKLLDHAGEHLAKIQDVPQYQQQYDQLEAQWKDLSQFAMQLRSHIQSDQNQQQDEQSQMSDDMQLGMAKIQGEHQLKATKMQGDMQLKAQNQAFKQHLTDAQTSSNIVRSNRVAAFDSQRKNAMAATDVHRKNVMSTTDMMRKNAVARNGASKAKQ